MKSEREEVRIFYTLTCDYCEDKSAEFEGDTLPDGWIGHEVPFDVEAFFEKNPMMLNSTGMFAGSTVYYFDSEEHLELWKNTPPSDGIIYLGIEGDFNET